MQTAAPSPSSRLFVALPVHRSVEAPTVWSMLQLQGAWPEMRFEMVIGDSQIHSARAHLVATFLETDYEHLLWVDSDSVFVPETVTRLLAAERDVIGVPFAMKKIVFPRAAAAAAARGHSAWEQAGLYFPAGFRPEVLSIERGSVRVDWIGCGLTLVRRRVFERMIEAYPELVTMVHDQRELGDPEPPRDRVPALFQPIIDPEHQAMLGEDISFCRRWTAMGGEVHALVEGPDVGHVGPHEYRGSLLGSLHARGMIERMPGTTVSVAYDERAARDTSM